MEAATPQPQWLTEQQLHYIFATPLQFDAIVSPNSNRVVPTENSVPFDAAEFLAHLTGDLGYHKCED